MEVPAGLGERRDGISIAHAVEKVKRKKKDARRG